MLGLLRAPSTFDLTNYSFSNGFQRTYFALYDNPYYTAYENPFTDDVRRINGNVYLSYVGKPWLNATYRVGIDSYSDRRRQVYAISSFANDPGDQTGQVNYNNLTNSDFYSDLIFTGGAKVTAEIDFNYTAGYNVATSNYTDNFSRGVSLTIPRFYDLTNAANLYSSSYQEKKYTSALFGQLDFDYGDMLYLSLTGRNEWSSTFGESQNNFFYPSASLSWVFSDVAKIPGLSFGKLRYAYSQAGISPSPYNTKTYFSLPTFTDGFTNGLTFPYNGISGFGYSASMGNKDLEPENVIGNEIGLDAKFLGNRLSLNLTLYHQKTKDILLFRPLAGSSGFQSEYANSGELENKGIELELKGNIIETTDFKWDIGINWSKNKSKVLKLAEGVKELSLESAFSDYGSYAIVGQPLGAFYGTKWQRSADGQLIIGDNGIPLKDSQTGNIGNPNPDWLAGIRNNFNFKGVQLSALFDIRHGGDVLNATYGRLTRLGRTAITADRERTYVIPGVKADGSVNTTPVSALNYFSRYLGDNGGAAEQFVETVNWFRVREITLSYRLAPQALTKYLNYIDLSVTGRNLLLETNYKGVDPETSLTGAGSNINGFDYFNNPGSKSFLFGINVGF
jgi:outer membrane receptor protein involved in Fe transport